VAFTVADAEAALLLAEIGLGAAGGLVHEEQALAVGVEGGADRQQDLDAGDRAGEAEAAGEIVEEGAAAAVDGGLGGGGEIF
jgi:hypothetical protein